MVWRDEIKMMLRNRIGHSEGIQFVMNIADSDKSIEVLTTRVDTVFGMSFAVNVNFTSTIDVATGDLVSGEGRSESKLIINPPADRDMPLNPCR